MQHKYSSSCLKSVDDEDSCTTENNKLWFQMWLICSVKLQEPPCVPQFLHVCSSRWKMDPDSAMPKILARRLLLTDEMRQSQLWARHETASITSPVCINTRQGAALEEMNILNMLFWSFYIFPKVHSHFSGPSGSGFELFIDITTQPSNLKYAVLLV